MAGTFDFRRQHIPRFGLGIRRSRLRIFLYVSGAKIRADTLCVAVCTFIAAFADLPGAIGFFGFDIGIGGRVFVVRGQRQHAFAAFGGRTRTDVGADARRRAVVFARINLVRVGVQS